MRNNRKLMADNRGVTPVIGVMLMIVVTVILAGAVSSYAGTMGSQDTAPQATFSAEASWTDGHITLNHLGGDILSKSNTKIEIASGTPLITGYVNMSNVTFAPKSNYLRPGDMATIEFIADYEHNYDPITWDDLGENLTKPRAIFKGDDISQTIKVGTPFRLTIIDIASGQTVYSKQLPMNP
jgi:flagellin-like protein